MQGTPSGRVVDTRNAVQIDFVDGCLIEHPTPGSPMYAMLLAGTVGHTDDRARCVYLLTPEVAGVLLDRVISLSGMIGPDFTRRLIERVQQLPSQPDPDLHTESALEPARPAASEAKDQRIA